MLVLLSVAHAVTCGDLHIQPIAGIGIAGESILQVDAETMTAATYEYNLGNSRAWVAAYQTEILLDEASPRFRPGSTIQVASLSPLTPGQSYTVWAGGSQANMGAPCSESRVKLTGDRDLADLRAGTRPEPILRSGSRGPGRVIRPRPGAAGPTSVDALPRATEADAPMAIPHRSEAPDQAHSEVAPAQPEAPPGKHRLSMSLPEGTRVKVFGDWYSQEATLFLKPGVYKAVIDAPEGRTVQNLTLDGDLDLCDSTLGRCGR